MGGIHASFFKHCQKEYYPLRVEDVILVDVVLSNRNELIWMEF